jgi:hypothetical protein
LVLSFSVAQQQAVRELVPAALESRANTFPILELPFLSGADARLFATDLFREFRSAEFAGTAEFPYCAESLDYVLDHAFSAVGGRLTPRNLMEALSRALLATWEVHDEAPPLPLDRASCEAGIARSVSSP